MSGNESQPPLFEEKPTLTTPDGVTIVKPEKITPVKPKKEKPQTPATPPPRPDPEDAWKSWTDH